jgi:hypothetical protein
VPITNVDATQLFDIDLGKAGKLPDFRSTMKVNSKSEAYSRCYDSFDWLFDPQERPGDKGSQDRDPMSAEGTGLVENRAPHTDRRQGAKGRSGPFGKVAYPAEDVNCEFSLPGFDRFSLESNPDDPFDKGGLITFSHTFSVAVVCIWKRYGPEKNGRSRCLHLEDWGYPKKDFR